MINDMLVHGSWFMRHASCVMRSIVLPRISRIIIEQFVSSNNTINNHIHYTVLANTMSGSMMVNESSTSVTDDDAAAAAAAANNCFDALEERLPPYNVDLFSNTRHIVRAHQDAPRFGNTNNISALLVENFQTEGKDYLKGVLWSSILIAVFVFLWMIALILLRFLGPRRVDLFSGRLPPGDATAATAGMVDGGGGGDGDGVESREDRQNSSSAGEVFGGGNKNEMLPDAKPGPELDVAEEVKEEEEKEEECNEQANRNIKNVTKTERISCCSSFMNVLWEKRLRNARIVVLTCGLGVVVSVILFISYGIGNFLDSLDAAETSLRKGEAVANGGVSLIETFLFRLNATEGLLKNLINDESELCPLFVDEYCANQTTFAAPEDCNATQIQEEMSDFLVTAEDFIHDNFAGSVDDLENIASELENIANTLDNIRWPFVAALAFAIAQACLTLLVCYGIVIAWRGKQKNVCRSLLNILRSWLLCPAFVFFTSLSFIFTLAVIFLSITTADFCYNSPDPKVLAVLWNNKDWFSSIVMYRLLLFYVGGCQPSGQLPPMVEITTGSILAISRLISQLLYSLSQLNSEEYQEFCGVPKTNFESLLKPVEETVCLLSLTMVDFQNWFQCSNWRPIYVDAIYDSICYHGTEGIYAISITQFMTVIFAMIMLTLRASFLVAPNAAENAHNSEHDADSVAAAERSTNNSNNDAGDVNTQ